MERRNVKETFKLSDMSEEEVRDFMESVDTGEEGDFDSDDEDNDPNYEPLSPCECGLPS